MLTVTPPPPAYFVTFPTRVVESVVKPDVVDRWNPRRAVPLQASMARLVSLMVKGPVAAKDAQAQRKPGASTECEYTPSCAVTNNVRASSLPNAQLVGWRGIGIRPQR